MTLDPSFAGRVGYSVRETPRISLTGLQNPTQARGPQINHFLVLKSIHPEPQGTLVFTDPLHGWQSHTYIGHKLLITTVIGQILLASVCLQLLNLPVPLLKAKAYFHAHDDRKISY